MEFRVVRTSLGFRNPDNKPPCNKAVFNGYNKRKNPEWSLEIASLEELLKLMKDEANNLVLSENIDGKITLEIYDDYRE